MITCKCNTCCVTVVNEYFLTPELRQLRLSTKIPVRQRPHAARLHSNVKLVPLDSRVLCKETSCLFQFICEHLEPDVPFVRTWLNWGALHQPFVWAVYLCYLRGPQCYGHGIYLIVSDQIVAKRDLVCNHQCFLPQRLHWRTIGHTLPVTGTHVWLCLQLTNVMLFVLATLLKTISMAPFEVEEQPPVKSESMWGKRVGAVERYHCWATQIRNVEKNKNYSNISTPSKGLKTNHTGADLWHPTENKYPQWTCMLGQV